MHLGNLAEEYHVASRNLHALRDFAMLGRTRFDPEVVARGSEPPLSLRGKRIALTRAEGLARMPLADAIRSRTSARAFGAASLEAHELGALLDLGSGVREVVRAANGTFYRRSAPCAGGLGSIEVYPIVRRVAGIPAGLYHFDSVRHELTELCPGDPTTWLRERVLQQPDLADAAVAFVLTCDLGRLAKKYYLQGYRLGLLDAGHVSENLQLTATAMGLGTCAVGGFIDDEVDGALGLDGVDRASVLLVVVGSAPRREG